VFLGALFLPGVLAAQQGPPLPALKEKAIARTAPLGAKPGRYRPADTLLAFLEQL